MLYNPRLDRADPDRLYSIHYGGYMLRNGGIFCKYAIGYPLILALFLKLFGFRIAGESLEVIGEFSIGKNWIEFKGVSKQDAESRLNIVLAQGFADLRNKVILLVARYLY